MRRWWIVVAVAMLAASCGSATFSPMPGTLAPGYDSTGGSGAVLEAPVVEDSTLYDEGTADHACDMFIRAINGWLPEATGTEYGPDMAGAVNTLIGQLEALDIRTATSDLKRVATIWKTEPWWKANEEASIPLIAAGEVLAGLESGRCGDLFEAVNPPHPVTEYEPPEPTVVEVVAVDEFDPGSACGRAHSPGGRADSSTEPLDDDAQQAVDALREAEEAAKWFTNTFRYAIFSRTNDELTLLGTADDGTLSDASFERIDGVWQPVGWGTCEWRPDGYERVQWQIHPELPPDPSAGMIDLLADDACGSVANSGYEDIVVAEYDDDSVGIAVWQSLHPPASSGGFSDLSCTIGTQVHLRVDLPEPIGDRTITGAGTSAP